VCLSLLGKIVINPMKQHTKLIFVSIILFIVMMNVASANNGPKEKTLVLSGKVLDSNHNETLSGVSIRTTASGKTVYSDLNGRFFIYIKIKDEKEFKLEFSQIGYQTRTFTAKDLDMFSPSLEINLIEE
jgi:hypothetical protein